MIPLHSDVLYVHDGQGVGKISKGSWNWNIVAG